MKLKYDNNALYRLDKECNLKFQDLSDPEKMGFATVVELLWAGLLHQNPDLTIQEVMDEHDPINNLEKYGQEIGKALEEAFPEAKGKN